MGQENNDNEVLVEEQATIVEDITPRDLLKFAKLILGVLALLFFAGALSEIIRPNNHVFEACKTILPPIATLVIGYYFGKSSS